MDLRDYLRVLANRKVFIIVCALLGVGLAALVTMRTTPEYQSRARVFVSAADASDTVGSAYTGSLFSQQRVKSYVAVAESTPVAEAVIDDLGLALTPEEVKAKVAATTALDSVVITLTATDPSPELAQQIALSLTDQFSAAVASIEQPTAGGKALVKVSVVEPATLPGGPFTPRPKVSLALGLLVGLAVGVGGAVLLETIDTRIKTIEEVADDSALPTLAVLARDPEVPKRPLITQAGVASPRAEAFRTLRTNLRYVDVDNAPRSFVVTSAVAQEGKSTTAANLAIAMAQAGEAVVLVEGDLRRPRVGELMGVRDEVGLTDVLIGRSGVHDVLQPWGGPGHLVVLAAGTLPPNPSELLGSQQMVDLLRELEHEALVVIDAPPLLPVTDAAVLSAVSGGALLVVALGRTRREQLRRAQESVHSVGGTLLGTVVNWAPPRGRETYGYGYGYGYAYGGEREGGEWADSAPRGHAALQPDGSR